MEALWELIRASLPDTIGGILSAAVIAVAGTIYAIWRRRNKRSRRRRRSIQTRSIKEIVVSFWNNASHNLRSRPRMLLIILLPLLVGGVSIAYFQWRDYDPPSGKIRILVADFVGPDAKERDVTNYLITDMSASLRPFDDVEVKPLGRPISGPRSASAAQEIGKKRNATIVIWGWYDIEGQEVSLSINFELLNKPSTELRLNPEANGKVQVFGLSGFSLQTNLSKQLVFLSLVTIGTTRYAVEDWPGAIERFTIALEQTEEPIPLLDKGKVFALRANANLWSEKYEAAINDYSEAIRLQFSDATVYSGRGIAYLITNRIDEAVQDCDSVTNLHPETSSPYSTCGSVYLVAGELEKALSTLNQAIELEPEPADMEGNLVNRGAVHIFMNHDEQALADYNEVLKINPQNTSAYYGRGLIYLGVNNLEMALQEFDQTIKLDPEDYKAYRKRGLIRLSQEYYEEAIRDLSKSIELEPNNDEAFRNRGVAFIKLGQYENAVKDFDQLVELQPSDPDAYYNRGCAYYQAGELLTLRTRVSSSVVELNV